MTAATTTLNAGSGGDKVLHDTLTTVDGSAAPAGAVAQVVKQAFGPQSDAKMVSDTTPLPTRAPLSATLPTTRAQISITNTTRTVIVAAVASQATRVHRMKFTVSAACTLTIGRGASTVLEALTFAGPGAVSLPFDPWPWYVTGTNEDFYMQSSAAVTITGSAECVTSA